MSLQLNNLLEGDLIKTDDLWTREDDADYIDDYIESSLLDVLYNMHEVDKDILEETSLEMHIKTIQSLSLLGYLLFMWCRR